VPVSISVSPAKIAEIGACMPDSASTSCPAAKLAVIRTVAPVIDDPASAVIVRAGSIFVAASPSAYTRGVFATATTGGSATHVTVIETVAVDPPLRV